MAASNIEYNVIESVGKEYVGRGDKQQKIVIQSSDIEIANTSPIQQNISTISYTLSYVQNYEITITKTTQIRTEKTVGIGPFKSTKTHTFTQKDVERTGETIERTMYFPSQNVTVEPLSKMNVTFNFVQYDDIIDYFLDFQIAENSTFSHLDVVDNNVVFLNKTLGSFLQTHREFLSTLKYENDTMLRLIEKDGKFILKNFPATEKITNIGVNVVFGKATNITEF